MKYQAETKLHVTLDRQELQHLANLAQPANRRPELSYGCCEFAERVLVMCLMVGIVPNPLKAQSADPPTAAEMVVSAAGLVGEIERLKRELALTEGLLKDRNRILDALPCPVHGPCVPYVLDRIQDIDPWPCPADCSGGPHDSHGRPLPRQEESP